MRPEQVQEKQSERVFWVIQTVFSFVLARSLVEYRECIEAPFAHINFPQTIGLTFIYLTVLFSWIDYSYTTIKSPYRFDKGLGEKLRFVSDLAIVGMYALLLFSLRTLSNEPKGDLTRLLEFVCAVFVLYFFSGFFRVLQYGPRASRLCLILLFAAAYIAMALGYSAMRSGDSWLYELNVATLICASAVMLLYRCIRARAAYRETWIAVDVDGVLADQIPPLLPVMSELAGRRIEKHEVIEWDMALGSTSLAVLIRDHLRQRSFVMSMAPIVGSRDGMNKLIKKYRIAIVTARPPESDDWTRAWLQEHQIPFDAYYNVREGDKHNIERDAIVLVDDYLGNIRDFIRHTTGAAVVFSQPWNSNRDLLKDEMTDNRVMVIGRWKDLPEAVDQLVMRARGKSSTQSDVGRANAG